MTCSRSLSSGLVLTNLDWTIGSEVSVKGVNVSIFVEHWSAAPSIVDELLLYSSSSSDGTSYRDSVRVKGEPILSSSGSHVVSGDSRDHDFCDFHLPSSFLSSAAHAPGSWLEADGLEEDFAPLTVSAMTFVGCPILSGTSSALTGSKCGTVIAQPSGGRLLNFWLVVGQSDMFSWYMSGDG